MQYFHHLPDIEVAARLNRLDKKVQFVVTKNIFRRVRVREDLLNYIFAFESISIGDGEMPWQLAHRAYGDATLDWVILLTNDIYDVYKDWPMSRATFDRYLEETYSLSGGGDGIHHYESIQIDDNETGATIVPGGVWVNPTWSVKANGMTYSGAGTSYTVVSNFEHEYYVNERKRNIFMPRPGLVNQFTSEFKDLVAYAEDDNTVDVSLKRCDASIIDYFVSIGNTTRGGSLSARNEVTANTTTGVGQISVAGIGTVVTTY